MTDRVEARIDGWDDLLLDEAGVDEAQSTALEVAQRTLPGNPELSLTIRPPEGRPLTRAATSQSARTLDEWQYDHGEGPCVAADVDLAVCLASDLADDPPFPRFADRARAEGIHGVASFPLVVGEQRSVGSLNVLYREPGRVTEEVADRGRQLAATLAPMLANFLTHQRVVELSDQLGEALEGRSIIERAKGLLMERMGIGADRAFELLSTQSQHENRKVRDVAAGLLDRHERDVRGQ